MSKKSKLSQSAEASSWWAQAEPEKVFSSLIGGCDANEFFSKTWEREPRIFPGSTTQRQGSLTELFSRECLDRILKKERIDFGLHLNSCRYVDGQRENLNPDENPETGEPIRGTAKRVWKLFDGERATLQFHQPQQFQESLWHLCSSLESYFGCLVGSNVYMTPGGAQGLAPHHDDVEVFIIQLEGKKHWRLYSPIEMLARTCSSDFDQSDIGEPTHDIVLEAGDVMYFPRGTVHQADTPDDVTHSTHITISTYQNWTYGDLLRMALPDALEAALTDRSAVAFRQGLPRNVMSSAGSAQAHNVDQRSDSSLEHITGKLSSLVQMLTKYLQPSPAVDELNVDFLRSRLPPPPRGSGKKEDTDAPSAKRKKTESGKADLGVVDLTNESGVGDPVGPKPTATSKVCLLQRNHVRVVIGRGLNADDDDDDDLLGGEMDSDMDSDLDDEIDDINAGNENEDSAVGLDGSGGFLVGNVDDDEDDEPDPAAACFIHYDFDNSRRFHMSSAADNAPLTSVKLPLEAAPAVGKLLARLTPIALSDLDLGDEDALDLATKLWAVGLLSAH